MVENATGSTDLQALGTPCSTATQTAGTATTNVSTRYTYVGVGQLETMVDAEGNTTTYTYDAAGHETGREDDLGEALIWRYDDIGNRVSQNNRTDAIPTNSVVWTYDPFGRVLTRLADSVTTTTTYDLNGNRLTVSDGSLTITATYDRLNRVLTVDDEDAGGTADTSYSYHFTSPAWSDVTGSYSATLDKFERPTMVNDPASGTNYTWTYGTGGQVLSGVQGNDNTITNTFDAAGRQLTSLVKDGATNRASYTYTYNRAGQVLSELADVGSDPADGSVTYAYDPLGRLSGSTLSGTTTAYAWDAATNRTSVQVGAGTAATTSYDDANRPTSGANPSVTYTSDDDGRLTARPNQTLIYDKLGRLTAVKNAAGTVTIAAYTYDPMDRLRTVDYGGGNRIRFRYTGLTSSAAQWLDDVAGTVTRSIGNGWTGEHLLDWTGSNSNRRYYGTNAHHDVTWTADSTGAIGQSLRFDPWGTPRSAVPGGYTPFRFQGSWHDATTDLAWVVTRWYAPGLGRFISEDTLLGQPVNPGSRHLYAYGAGDPVGTWDPDGRMWFRLKPGKSLGDIAEFWLDDRDNWGMIRNANRGRDLSPGKCAWVPMEWVGYSLADSFRLGAKSDCARNRRPRAAERAEDAVTHIKQHHGQNLLRAARTLNVNGGWYNLRIETLINRTTGWTGRSQSGGKSEWDDNVRLFNREAEKVIANSGGYREIVLSDIALIFGNTRWPSYFNNALAWTYGRYIFVDDQFQRGQVPNWLLTHEYVHVLQYEGFGPLIAGYGLFEGGGSAANPYEAIAYLWEGWDLAYSAWETREVWDWWGRR